MYFKAEPLSTTMHHRMITYKNFNKPTVYTFSNMPSEFRSQVVEGEWMQVTSI